MRFNEHESNNIGYILSQVPVRIVIASFKRALSILFNTFLTPSHSVHFDV